MKLAVFGDSFADFSSDSTPRDVDYAWFNILAKKLDAKLFHYGIRGSAVYNSYKNFLKSYKKYDIVVFIVSNPNRYTKFYKFSDGVSRNVGSITYCEYLRKHFVGFTDYDYKLLDGITNHLMFDDDEFKEDMSELMLQHMESLHNKIIFYPAFENSFNSEREKKEQIPKKYNLQNLQLKQSGQLKMESNKFIRETEQIIGHLTHEYNNALAEVLYSRLTQCAYNFSFFDRIHTIKMPKEFYYDFN